MIEDLRARRFEWEGRPASVLAAGVRSVLRSAETPLTLGEVSIRLERPFRAVAGVLAAACHDGTVDRLEGGLYTLRLNPALAELFAVVRACEAHWYPVA